MTLGDMKCSCIPLGGLQAAFPSVSIPFPDAVIPFLALEVPFPTSSPPAPSIYGHNLCVQIRGNQIMNISSQFPSRAIAAAPTGLRDLCRIRGHWSSCREPITLGCLSWFKKSLRCPLVFDLRVLEWVNAFSSMTNACLGAGLARGNPTLSICQAPQGPWDLCRGSGLQRSPRESNVSAVGSWPLPASSVLGQGRSESAASLVRAGRAEPPVQRAPRMAGGWQSLWVLGWSPSPAGELLHSTPVSAGVTQGVPVPL